MSRRRGRRRPGRARAVTFPFCHPSDTKADQQGGRQRFVRAAVITVLVLVAVTSIAAVTMTVQSLSNTDVDDTASNLPPYRSAGVDDSEGLSSHNGWKTVRVKRDFVENDTEVHPVPYGMASTDAPSTMDPTVPMGMTPPTGHVENARVPDQTETLRSEGWKRFRVEQMHTDDHDVYSHTEIPTGDEEGEGFQDWDYTAGESHCSDVRVRRRVSKVPHDSETFPATDDSPAANMTHLEPKPNSALDKKVSGDVDNTSTTAMDNVGVKNFTDLNLYLDAVLTEHIKSHERKHRVLKGIRRSKAIVLVAVGVLIAGSVAYSCLAQIPQ